MAVPAVLRGGALPAREEGRQHFWERIHFQKFQLVFGAEGFVLGGLAEAVAPAVTAFAGIAFAETAFAGTASAGIASAETASVEKQAPFHRLDFRQHHDRLPEALPVHKQVFQRGHTPPEHKSDFRLHLASPVHKSVCRSRQASPVHRHFAEQVSDYVQQRDTALV